MATVLGLEQYVWGIAAGASGLITVLMGAPNAVSCFKRWYVSRFEKHEKSLLKQLSIIDAFRQVQKLSNTDAWAFNGQVRWRSKHELWQHNLYRRILGLEDIRFHDANDEANTDLVQNSLHEIKSVLHAWEHEQEHNFSSRVYLVFALLAFVFLVLNQWPR